MGKKAMKRSTLIMAGTLALAISSAQVVAKECFQLSDDDPLLLINCPPMKLAQGESRGLTGEASGFGNNGSGNQNQNQNQNNNQNQSQNNNQNQNNSD